MRKGEHLFDKGDGRDLGHGLTHAMIGVDSENPSGTFALYQRLGFTVSQGNILSQLELARPTNT